MDGSEVPKPDSCSAVQQKSPHWRPWHIRAGGGAAYSIRSEPNTATINAAAKATVNPIAVGVRRAVKKVGVSWKKVERELGVLLSMKASFRGDAATHFSFNYPPGSVMMFTQLHDFCGGHAGSEDWSHAKRILCRAPRLYGQSAARPALRLVKFAATDGRDPMKSTIFSRFGIHDADCQITHE